MTDFSHLRGLHVTETSEAEYTFEHPITGEAIASLICRPMTDDNPAFLNERVRIAVERAEQAKKETKAERRTRVLSTEQLDEDRELDRVLIARTVAKAWGLNPQDSKGKTHEFSEQTCYDFLKALPNYMFDPFRGWAGNVYNFIPRPPVDPATAETLGNS